MTQVEKDLIHKMMLSWEHIGEFKKGLGLQVNASKADTRGSTGSVAGLIQAKERVQEMRYGGGGISGFDEKIDGNTTLSHYTKASIDWVTDLLGKNSLFIMGTEGGRNMAVSVANEINKGTKRKENFFKTFEKSMLSYTYSQVEGLQMTQNEQQKIMNRLPGRVLDIKTRHEDNFFINNLQVTGFKGKTILKVDGRNTPRTFRNYMYRGWTELLQSENQELKQLGEDLVKYAYAQSGFQYNMNEFFTYIPHWYLMDLGIVNAVKGTVNRIEQTQGEAKNLKEQFYRHNWEDASVVTRMSEDDLKDSDQKHLSGAVRIDWNTTKFTTQEFVQGVPYRTFPKFINYNGGLYQLHVNSNGGLTPKKHPVYFRTFKLGGDQQVEYGGLIEKSVSAENNVTQAEVAAWNKFAAANKLNSIEYQLPDIGISPIDGTVYDSMPEDIQGQVEPDVLPEDNGTPTAQHDSNPNVDEELNRKMRELLGEDPDQEQRLYSMGKDHVSLFMRKIDYF